MILLYLKGPDVFSFADCQFKIKKCKESTGRVVMWKQFNIHDSFTLETTFSGTVLNKFHIIIYIYIYIKFVIFFYFSRRHLNISDLENIGKIFSESLLTYISVKGDKR